MRAFSHSSGICFIDESAQRDNGDFSFAVYSSGKIVEYYGWGKGGSVPQMDVNSVEGEVHTVWVQGLTEQVKQSVMELIDHHRGDYNECRVYCWPQNSELASWFASGMPGPDERVLAGWGVDREEEVLT